ncbi:uncharacterized protein LOC124957207 [Vespa velutina]|uniref:uncharacterized protein LOC124957207 n=1 Tax=Vespa velutina TaxID=202808 RepID=UPI001FB3EED9|nr:uncharacterized protein LOC124957207 [Vespa velutina]
MGIANYSMFVAIIQHTCALFNIIEWRVYDRFKKYSHNFHYVDHYTDLVEETEWLIGIVKYRNSIIEFVNLIRSFYETVYLFEVLLASIVIMIDYFYILSFNLNGTEGLTNICYVIGSLFVIYIYYYLGQKLIDHSENVFKAFCQIPFYSLSAKTKKILLFLIMSSMRISYLSLAGVKEVSNDLFASLMRSSFSIAMVFYNLQ